MLDYDKIVKEKRILNIDGLESKILCDQKYAYKLFYTLKRRVLNNKFYKVNILSSLTNFTEGVQPIDNIMDNNCLFRGYSCEKIEGITLADLFLKRGLYDFIIGLIDSSQKLHAIHERPENIILSDVHPRNIMLRLDVENQYTNSIFLDLDNAKIDGLKNNYYSAALYNFYRPRIKKMVISKNSDRLTELLYLLNYIFDEPESLYQIDMYTFDKKAEEINCLLNIRNLFRTLIDNIQTIPKIPYIYEIMNTEEIKSLKLEGGRKNVF